MLYRPGRDAGGGYRGRSGIYELIMVDDTMRTMIHDGVSEQELERYARRHTPSIRDDGLAECSAARRPSRKCCASPARIDEVRLRHGCLRIHRARHRPASSRKGVIEGDTPRHMRHAAARAAAPAGHGRTRSRRGKRTASGSLQLRPRGVSPADLSLFTRQLATLVRAGLPLEESLLAVSQQTEKPRVQSIMLGVRRR